MVGHGLVTVLVTTSYAIALMGCSFLNGKLRPKRDSAIEVAMCERRAAALRQEAGIASLMRMMIYCRDKNIPDYWAAFPNCVLR